jgi:hypothetical protein
MQKQGRPLTEAGVVFVLALVLYTGCAPKGREGVTPEASPTATEVSEATVGVSPTPTPTIVPGGGVGETTAEPTPIPICSNLELKIEFQQVQSMQAGEIPIENEINASGSVPLFVDVGVSPPKVNGEGELPVSGGGHAGECAFQDSGTLAYRFEGEIILGADGYPELHLGGQRAMNVVASPLCGGRATTPFEEVGEQVLRYEEGYTVEWSWAASATGVEGNSKWVLHILCEE